MKTLVKEITLVGITGTGDAVGSARIGLGMPQFLRGVQIDWTGQSSGTAILMVTNELAGVSKEIYDGAVQNDVPVPLVAITQLAMDDGGTMGPTTCPPVLAGELLLDVTLADDGTCVVTLLLELCP